MAASIANIKGVNLATLSDDVMYEEMLNPNFTVLEAANIELKNTSKTPRF